MLSDICSITALFRTAAGVRFRAFAILSAPVFCRASFFKVFTSSDVQGFLFGAFAITRSIMVVNAALIAKWAATRKPARVDQSDQSDICLSSPCHSFGAISRKQPRVRGRYSSASGKATIRSRASFIEPSSWRWKTATQLPVCVVGVWVSASVYVYE